MIRRFFCYCFAFALLALAACSPKEPPTEASSATPRPAVHPVAASGPPPTERTGCSSPEVQDLIGELVWEGVGKHITEELAADRVPDVTAAAKANVKLALRGIATVPGQNGARPTCEASIVGTAERDINADSNWLRRAMQLDPSVAVRGRELVGAVEYTVQPSDDGRSFRVSASGIEAYALGLAGVGLGLRTAAMQAKWEADQKAAPAPATPAGTSAADLQAEAAAAYQAADKALNAAYQSARAAMTEAQRAALRDEQRAWIKTRDAACSETKIGADSKGDVAGDPAMALEVAGCKARLTAERARQLLAKG